jgi:tRNA G46 methylase TrmB
MNLLDKIYSKYVSIKVSENNLISDNVSNIISQTTDTIYSPDELYDLIERRKEALNNDSKFVYGEIRKSGVETLYKEIKSLSSSLDTFVDVGSGTGKICLHLSLISDFENIVGIEIVTGRYLYALELQQSLQHDFDNVVFVNDDVLKIEFERPCVVFVNDVCFPKDLTSFIWERLPIGSHFISFKNFGNSIKQIYLDVTWQKEPNRWYYYIKT